MLSNLEENNVEAELIKELETLSQWPESALDAWLEHRDPISRSNGESDADYRGLCLEAWTASGARAEAEEEAAGQAALVARRVLARLNVDGATSTPAFSIDHAALQRWWTHEVDVGVTVIGEVYRDTVRAVEDFVHGSCCLKGKHTSVGLEVHATSEDGVVDGFVLAIYDAHWPRGPFRLSVASGHIAANDVDPEVMPAEFAQAIVDIANSLCAAATSLRVTP